MALLCMCSPWGSLSDFPAVIENVDKTVFSTGRGASKLRLLTGFTQLECDANRTEGNHEIFVILFRVECNTEKISAVNLIGVC